jgi:hypothetical protein
MCRESFIDFSKYEVYKDGSIKSIRFGTLLSDNNAHPYIMNELRLVDGTCSAFQRHRVIWVYFNGDIPEGMQIDHIDGNKLNNSLSNLRCVTRYENVHNPNTYQNFLDAVKSKEHRENLSKALTGIKMSEERYDKCFPTMFKVGHETSQEIRHKISDKNSKPIDQIDKITGEIVHSWKSASEAARQLHINVASINKCCNGGEYDKRRNKWVNILQYKGYIWKFIN